MMKVGKNKVWFDKERLDEIKEAITKVDIAGLIKQLAIQKRPSKGTSKVRARKRKEQKRKGRQSGPGHRKGKQTARLPKKEKWIDEFYLQVGGYSLAHNKVYDSNITQEVILLCLGRILGLLFPRVCFR